MPLYVAVHECGVAAVAVIALRPVVKITAGLAKHSVTHVFNSWEAMPPVSEQLALTGSIANDSLVAARFLLKPGRKYEDAVQTFQPYDRIREINDEARSAGAKLIAEGVLVPHRQTYIYVNNRLEGNALQTIEGMLARLQMSP